MSLKGFHLFFVSISIFLAVVSAGWGFALFRETGESGYLWFALLSVGGIVILTWYGVRVRKKLHSLRQPWHITDLA